MWYQYYEISIGFYIQLSMLQNLFIYNSIYISKTNIYITFLYYIRSNTDQETHLKIIAYTISLSCVYHKKYWCCLNNFR